MKALFEIDINEDYKRAIVSQYFLMVFTFLLSISVRAHEKSIIDFSFLLELTLLVLTFKFYFQAQKKRNYAYWGITFVLASYLLLKILHYTFIDYNIFILYISFLAAIFLSINCYVMSSPLFFPRVQWWEYDFRYRGDLKIIVKDGSTCFEGRLTDFRRGCCSIEVFGHLELDENIKVELDFKDQIFIISGEVKTKKEVTPGRPLRYGVKFDLSESETKSVYNEVKRVWDANKKAKVIHKFSSINIK